MKDPLPLTRSVKSCIWCSVAVAAPYLFFLLPGQAVLGPLPAFYASLVTIYLLPTALCMAAMIGGALAMGVGVAVSVGAMASLTGMPGVKLTAVYLLPILIAFFAVVYFQIPFWKSLAIVAGAHLAALAAVYMLAQQMAGGDLYTAAGNAVADFLENWEMGDLMLYQLYDGMGMLDLKSELADTALEKVLGGYQLSQAARADLLLSVRAMVTEAMQALVPNLIVSRSILGGVSCLLLPLRFGFLAEEKRAFKREAPADLTEEGKQKIDFPDLGMPPFSQWHLPRGIGWQVGAALAVGYLLRANNTPALGIAGAILYAGASAVFTVQGAAAINFLQKQRGSRRFWRVLVPCLLALTQILVFVGVFDQISNFRRLRKPPEPKEDFDL